jgi:hypothetical protein
MALHGGRYEMYYHRATVTHIICSNLPNAKVKAYEAERNPTPVVRPEWVVECIKAGCLLPVRRGLGVAVTTPLIFFFVCHGGAVDALPVCVRGLPACKQANSCQAVALEKILYTICPVHVKIKDFVLWQLRDVPGQRTLKAFAPVKSATLAPDEIFGPLAHARTGIPVAEALPPSVAAFLPHAAAPRDQGGRDIVEGKTWEWEEEVEEKAVEGKQEDWMGEQCSPKHYHDYEQQQQHQNHHQQQQQQHHHHNHHHHHQELQFGTGSAATGPPSSRAPAAGTSVPASTAGAAAYDPAEMREAQQVAARMRAACDVLRGPPRSSKDDPNFVETYYKSSRLHFIGEA